jgi:hypothetical protein
MRRIQKTPTSRTGLITDRVLPAPSLRQRKSLPVFASFAAMAFVLVSVASPLSQTQAVAAEQPAESVKAPTQELVVAGATAAGVSRGVYAVVEIPKPVVVAPVIVEEAPATSIASAPATAKQAAPAPVAAAAAPAAGTPDPGSAKAIAHEMVLARGWGEDQYNCLVSLWTRESGWNTFAENKSSGAYGIPQSLPGSKMASAGADWQTNPATQITWGLGYITSRYSTPCGAWQASESKGWY